VIHGIVAYVAYGLLVAAFVTLVVRRWGAHAETDTIPDEEIAGYLYSGAGPSASELEARNERVVTVSPRVASLAEAGIIGVADLHGMNRAQRRAFDHSLRRKGR
jgi:hypothetical protein